MCCVPGITPRVLNRLTHLISTMTPQGTYSHYFQFKGTENEHLEWLAGPRSHNLQLSLDLDPGSGLQSLCAESLCCGPSERLRDRLKMTSW